MTKKIYHKTRSEPVFYTIIGISCQLMDYRFLHHLNRELDFNFIKEEDLQISRPGLDQPVLFSFYLYNDEDRQNFYYLVSNHSLDTVLVPEFRHSDFILFIDGDFSKKQKDPFLRIIRKLPKVQTAFEINISDIKNAVSLLTEIELHISGINHRNNINNKPVQINVKGGKSHV